jgi:hypothetical protein
MGDDTGASRHRRRPEAWFALQHYSFMVVVQCVRLEEAVEGLERVDHLSEFDPVLREAKHLVLGERFLLLSAGREMVRALDQLKVGRLPGRMHQDLIDFRDALSHWDEWGKGKKAEASIQAAHPGAWPYEWKVEGGEFYVGGSLRASELEAAAKRLYEWTHNLMGDHGLEVEPDLTTHLVTIEFDKARFFPMARALEKAGLVAGGANDYLTVHLLDPTQARTVARVARRVDPEVRVGEVRPIPNDWNT